MPRRPEQSLESLALANARRIAIANRLNQIREADRIDGMLDVVKILENPPPEEIGAMRLEKLLSAPKGMGKTHVRRIITPVFGTQPSQMLRTLTERQRTALVIEVLASLTDYQQRDRQERRRRRRGESSAEYVGRAREVVGG